MTRKFALFSRLANFLEDRYRSHPANFLVYSAIVTAVIGGLILAALLGLPKSLSDSKSSVTSSTEAPSIPPEVQIAEPERLPSGTPGEQVRLRDTVRVFTADPVIHPCVIATSTACFRLAIQVSTATKADLQVGYDVDGPAMAGTHAIFADGTVCKGYPAGGLYYFSDVQDIELQTAAPDRPISGVIEFACDGELLKGEQASVQIGLSLARAGIGQQKTRFNVANLPLRAQGMRD